MKTIITFLFSVYYLLTRLCSLALWILPHLTCKDNINIKVEL